MSYSAITDFLALLRSTSSGERIEQMPGLDYVVAALARMGLFQLSVSQTAPVVNQQSTVWLRPALPSWSAEGTVWLWNSTTQEYETATPSLWESLLASASTSSSSFQEITGAAGVINSGTNLLAVVRNAPTATALTLPNLAAQAATGRELKIVDFSTNVTRHIITLSTPDGSSIIQPGVTSFQLQSTAVQLSGARFTPSTDLNAWVLTP